MFKAGDKVKIFSTSGKEARRWVQEFPEDIIGYVVNVKHPSDKYTLVQYNHGKWWTEKTCLEFVKQLSKEERLFYKIKKLYKKCPTTKHWAIE